MFPGATLLNNLGPKSFAGWVSRETDPDGGYVIAKRSTTSGYWRIASTNTNVEWMRSFSGNSGASYLGGGSLPIEQWTHVAFVWDGKSSGIHSHLYLNGVQVANPTRTNGDGSPVSDAANLFTIGNRPEGNTSFFKGSLDDFRIWIRSLTPTDVDTLYRAPSVALNDAN